MQQFFNPYRLCRWTFICCLRLNENHTDTQQLFSAQSFFFPTPSLQISWKLISYLIETSTHKFSHSAFILQKTSNGNPSFCESTSITNIKENFWAFSCFEEKKMLRDRCVDHCFNQNIWDTDVTRSMCKGRHCQKSQGWKIQTVKLEVR